MAPNSSSPRAMSSPTGAMYRPAGSMQRRGASSFLLMEWRRASHNLMMAAAENQQEAGDGCGAGAMLL